MLFDNDIRYDEFLNEFDVMASDYSSIVYDFLLLYRPVVYLLPDFDEYKQAKGFVFSNIDAFMPGEKTADFKRLLSALTNAFENPEEYAGARKNVILNRFDYTDGKSTERCFRQIMEFHKISDEYTPYKSDPRTVMPSTAELLGRYIDSDSCLLIDSRKVYSDKEALRNEIARAKKAYYITGEIPSEFRSMSVRNSYKIEDLELYNEMLEMPGVNVAFISGGVDYDKFSAGHSSENKTRTRIGFAGTIDNRIYFSMVHCICEEFPDCEIMFAGMIIGDYPAWLSGFDNLVYKEVSYNELPDIISSFDAAILPFFGAHCNTVPSELFQYLACGKNVVTSDMPNLPECPAIHRSASVAEVIDNIRQVLSQNNCSDTIDAAKSVAEQHSWENIAKGLLNDEYNFCVDNG